VQHLAEYPAQRGLSLDMLLDATDAGFAGVGRYGRNRRPNAGKSAWPRHGRFAGVMEAAGIEPAQRSLRSA
jgi:hypothetical protein